ncbi:MAG: ABC transporter ATP-binding protein [Candidatus Thorarchaeota archaeon]
MLSVKNLNSGYDKFCVLYDVNVEVPEKQISVVVGPNGAGKTTLLNSISGLATITGGEIIYKGENITGIPSYVTPKIGISMVPQSGNVFADLTVMENLTMAGYTLDSEEANEQAVEVLEFFPALKDFVARKAGTLSGGERRMLAIGMGLVRKPKLMLLDEVSMDLAPILAKRVIAKVAELRDEFGLTILLVEQMAKAALEIGDNAYLLTSGEMRFSGDAKDLLKNPELGELYLGIKKQ